MPGGDIDDSRVLAGVLHAGATDATDVGWMLEHLLDLILGKRSVLRCSPAAFVERIGDAGKRMLARRVEIKSKLHGCDEIGRDEHAALTAKAKRDWANVLARACLGSARVAHLLTELVALGLSQYCEHAEGQPTRCGLAIDRFGRTHDLDLTALQFGGGLVLDQHLPRETVELVDEYGVEVPSAGVSKHPLKSDALRKVIAER